MRKKLITKAKAQIELTKSLLNSGLMSAKTAIHNLEIPETYRIDDSDATKFLRGETEEMVMLPVKTSKAELKKRILSKAGMTMKDKLSFLIMHDLLTDEEKDLLTEVKV